MAADRAAWLRRRAAIVGVVGVVVVLVLGATVQWFRPLSAPTLQGLERQVPAPGAPPRLPWPSTGEATASVGDLGSLGGHLPTRAVPIGVLSGVLVAYVVLKDHPISTGGGSGPSIPVTADTVAAYRAGSAAGQPEVPVSPGESLTELQALEGLLVASGSDMATMLADWDAGSTPSFVDRMDLTALSLGLRHTRVAEPGGADDAVVSTPVDLVRLAEAAMALPVFRQIVSLGEVSLPGAGVEYNPNFTLGQNGVIGVEAGADTTIDGAYLFAGQESVGGQTVTVYGAVLGQSGPDGPDTAAVDAGRTLLSAALSDLTPVAILPADRVVGRLATPWGASTPVMVSQPVTILAWPGMTVSLTARLAKLTLPLRPGSDVGSLQIREGSRVVKVALRSTTTLARPSGLWRLKR